MSSVSLGSTSLMFTCPRYRAASISASSRTTGRRASGYIVRQSMISAPILTVLVAVPHQTQARAVRLAIESCWPSQPKLLN